MFRVLYVLSYFLIPSLVFAHNPSSIPQVKQKILILAKQTMAQNPKAPEVREKLDQLVAELLNLAPAVTEDTWLENAPGTWRQIWSDERDNSPPGSPALDLSQVYQYLGADGRAVNFGIRNLPGGGKITFALEAVGSVKGNVQQTTILKGFSRGSGLVPGENIELLSQEILNGTSQDFQYMKLPEFPKGPIGATSPLTFLYMDQNLKIGTAPNAFTGLAEMFIVERVYSVD